MLKVISLELSFLEQVMLDQPHLIRQAFPHQSGQFDVCY